MGGLIDDIAHNSKSCSWSFSWWLIARTGAVEDVDDDRLDGMDLARTQYTNSSTTGSSSSTVNGRWGEQGSSPLEVYEAVPYFEAIEELRRLNAANQKLITTLQTKLKRLSDMLGEW